MRSLTEVLPAAPDQRQTPERDRHREVAVPFHVKREDAPGRPASDGGRDPLLDKELGRARGPVASPLFHVKQQDGLALRFT